MPDLSILASPLAVVGEPVCRTITFSIDIDNVNFKGLLQILYLHQIVYINRIFVERMSFKKSSVDTKSFKNSINESFLKNEFTRYTHTIPIYGYRIFDLPFHDLVITKNPSIMNIFLRVYKICYFLCSVFVFFLFFPF